jgi:hypothetical protein
MRIDHSGPDIHSLRPLGHLTASANFICPCNIAKLSIISARPAVWRKRESAQHTQDSTRKSKKKNIMVDEDETIKLLGSVGKYIKNDPTSNSRHE